MWGRISFLAALATLAAAQFSWGAADNYQLGPDSMFKPDVPHGRVEKFAFDESKVYPGTHRDCWIYIPAQYDETKPPALMVFQDGGGYVTTNGQQRIPVVFDNLIAAKENYPSMIRKTERKPIRVFLQDGSNDLNNLHGNWPLASQEMDSALQFMGYDHKFVFGTGTHSGKHGGAIMPETLRWLWRPEIEISKPLTKDNLKGDEALSKVLPDDSQWELVGEGYGFTDAACSDAKGNFYFSDLPNATIYRLALGETKPAVWLQNGLKISGLKPGPDGQLYAATQGTLDGAKNEKKKIVAIDLESKKITAIANDVEPNDLIVSKAGWIYFTDTGKGEVVRVPTSARNMARPQTAAGGIDKPNGISLSADQNFLIVSEYGGSNVWTFVIGEDGSLHSGERYMTLVTPAGKTVSGGDGMTTDTQSRYYVTSLAGIQMFDWTGRLGGVIAKPNDKTCVSVAFAGPRHEWLYACASDKVFRRKTLAEGAIFAGE